MRHRNFLLSAKNEESFWGGKTCMGAERNAGLDWLVEQNQSRACMCLNACIVGSIDFDCDAFTSMKYCTFKYLDISGF